MENNSAAYSNGQFKMVTVENAFSIFLNMNYTLSIKLATIC